LIDTAGNQVDITRTNDDGTYTLCAAGEGHYLLICASPPHQPCAERIIVAAGQLWHDVVLPGGTTSRLATAMHRLQHAAPRPHNRREASARPRPASTPPR
jgi:hypothetical protein